MSWIIGDIHGCFYELSRLLRQLPPNDELIFLGDYIDRGEDSYRVVERLLEEQERSRFLMGNHEMMMLQYFKKSPSERDRIWLDSCNGGRATLKSYRINESSPFEAIPKNHRNFFNRLLPYYQKDDFIAVHAGFRVNKEKPVPPSEQLMEDMLWIRKGWINSEALWHDRFVYYGHTPTESDHTGNPRAFPRVGKRSLGIDTGAVYGGYLTAVKSTNRNGKGEMIQVKSESMF